MRENKRKWLIEYESRFGTDIFVMEDKTNHTEFRYRVGNNLERRRRKNPEMKI